MEFSRDYAELFSTFNAHRVRFLVVGAQAVMYHSVPRYTRDMDVWVPPALNDPRRVYTALKAFGAPLRALAPGDFANLDMVLQIGVEPVRVDVMMDVPGVDARRAWRRRVPATYGGASIAILGLEDLLAAKRAAGRPQDRLDVARLLLSARLRARRVRPSRRPARTRRRF